MSAPYSAFAIAVRAGTGARAMPASIRQTEGAWDSEEVPAGVSGLERRRGTHRSGERRTYMFEETRTIQTYLALPPGAQRRKQRRRTSGVPP